MEKLTEDRHFAMDFWAFIGKLSNREQGDLTDQQLLSIVVEGVAGEELPDPQGKLKDLVGELSALLSGVDTSAPTYVEPLPFSRDSSPHPEMNAHDGWENRPVSEGDALPSQAYERARAISLSNSASDSPNDGALGPEAHPSLNASDPYRSPQLQEDLRRLQMASLEVKQHLDDIDQRMSRLEPLAHPSPSSASSSVKSSTVEAPSLWAFSKPSAPETSSAPVEHFTRDTAGKQRLVLQPDQADEPSGPALFASIYPADTENRYPFENDEARREPNRLAFLVLAVLLVAGSVFFLKHSQIDQRADGRLHQLYTHLTEKVQALADAQKPLPSPQLPALQLPDQSAATSEDGTPAPDNKASTSDAISKLDRLANPPSAVPLSSNATPSNNSAQPATSTLIPPPSLAARPAPRAGRSRLESQAEAAAMADRAYSATADEAAAINVAPSVMEANLVLSRVPVYPDVAKADHVEGPVVAKAIISKAGTVENVHIIQGDPLLRRAAAEAIYKWRYRPYLLNGQPVQVATTITVDFTPNR
jgi:TonB family protein